MHERLEQLVHLHKMCLQELHQLQTNVEHYSQTSTDMVNTIKIRWPDIRRGSGFGLMVYDNFLTSITDVMNLSRKINLQLHLYRSQTEDNPQMFDIFVNGNESNHIPANKEICDKSLNNLNQQMNKIELVNNSQFLYPAEEISMSKNTEEEFTYPKQNLNDFYEIGCRIKAFITYLKDVDDLTFYVVDFHSEYVDTMKEVAQSIDLHQYHTLPPAHEVFGLVLDNRIIRAVRSPKVLYDQELNEEVWPCFLLDFGEVVHMKMSDIKYKLNDKHKATTSLALLCQLKGDGPLNGLQEQLRHMEYLECELKIFDIKDQMLVVELIEEDSSKPTAAPPCEPKNTTTQHKQAKKETNPFKQAGYADDAYKLTDAELDMLYDEPLCTSNAMKAVMGYDPQDEKRICRFYDPETGACFKGSHCKQEHVPLHPEGWTKDVLPAVSIIDNRSPLIVYPKGAIINITPTYIGQLGLFYAQINDPHHNNSPLIWNDEDLPAWKRLEKPPHIFELVLSRYEDNLWYRAKVISHDDDYRMFKVFYVDYGNHQIVHLRNLAKCDRGMAQIPFQATLCRIAGVRDTELTAEKKRAGIEKLCSMILNQTVDAKVVSHHEDLIISFVSEKHQTIPRLLIDEGYMVPYRI